MASNTHTAHARNDGKLSSLTDEITGMRDTLTEGAQSVTDSGRRVLGAAGATARKALTDARDSSVEYRDRAGKIISDRPFHAVAIAAVAGAAAMGLFMLWRRR